MLEIVVVVVIIALMAGAIIPTLFSGMDRNRLESASQVISNAFNYCYSSAITEGRRYRWTWDEQAQRARYLYERDPLQTPGEFVPAMVGERQNEALPPNVQLEGVYFPMQPLAEDQEAQELPPEITFYPDGHATSAQVVVQTVAPNGTPDALTIMLNGATGRVKIVSGNAPMAQMQAESGEQPASAPAAATTSEGAQP